MVKYQLSGTGKTSGSRFKMFLIYLLITMGWVIPGKHQAQSLTLVQSIRERFHLQDTSFQILCLKGADCSNCHAVGKNAITKNILKPKLIVLQDIPKRLAKEFIEEDFHLPYIDSLISFDNDLWNQLNQAGTSVVVYIDKDKVTKSTLLKNLLSPPTNQSAAIHDSTDLTSIFGGPFSKVYPFHGNYLVYDDMHAKIYELNMANGTSELRFSGKNLIPIDSVAELFSDVRSWRIDYTKKLAQDYGNLVSIYGKMGEPYVTPNYVYIPMTVSMADTMAVNGKREDILKSNAFFIRLSHSWKNRKLIGFPYLTLNNSDRFGNSLSHGHFKNDSIFYMLNGVVTGDSLFFYYNLNQRAYEKPLKLVQVAYPKHFPLKNSRGHYILYTSHFLSDNNRECFYFALDNRIYDLNSKQAWSLDSIPVNDLTQETPHRHLMEGRFTDSNLELLVYDPVDGLICYTFNKINFGLISKRSIYKGPITDAFFDNHFICVINGNADTVLLRRYQW
ncbi:MAG: hypothetical protein U0T84_02905 [Chitinophagales bacterium]